MAKMIDAITVDRLTIFKGAGRLVRRVSTTVPTKLEDIMEPAGGAGVDYALASGWVDLGPTTPDGMTFTRTAALSDGIAVDQRKTALDKGEPDSWSAGATATLLNTTYQNLVYALEYGTVAALGSTGSRVAQHSVSIDAPAAFTEAQIAFIQEDISSLKSRAWWFRKCVPAVDTEVPIKGSEATGIQLKLTINVDETVSEGSGQFGLYFEQD